MKRSGNIIILTGIFALASCNVNSPDMIREQIIKKKDKIRTLNQQISRLEDQLDDDPAGSNSNYMIPVTLQTMNQEPFNHFIEVTGKLEAEEDAFISPEMNGQIKKIHVSEGDRVTGGQLLVSLNTSITESSINEVKTSLELARKLYEKQKELWEQQIGSELQYLEAKNAMEQAEARLSTLRAQLDMALIKAPFSGVVETIFLKEGELAVPGMQVLQLVSLRNLRLYADVSEEYLGSLRESDPVQIEFPGMEIASFSLPIHRIGNLIDNESRTFRIELKVPNPTEELKPNMFTVIRINDFSAERALVVPSLVIKQDIRGSYLYTARQEEGRLIAAKSYIGTGRSYKDRTMVTDGLNRGDRVIIEGFSQVSDGVEVRVP